MNKETMLEDLYQYTYITFVNLDDDEQDVFRCIARDDSDATHQFYDWCREHNIKGRIVDIG